MEGFALIVLVVIGLAVIYKLGLFGPIVDLSDVATRESAAYNRDHKDKVARRYLGKNKALTEAEVKKINDNIAAIDSLNFD